MKGNFIRKVWEKLRNPIIEKNAFHEPAVVEAAEPNFKAQWLIDSSGPNQFLQTWNCMLKKTNFLYWSFLPQKVEEKPWNFLRNKISEKRRKIRALCFCAITIRNIVVNSSHWKYLTFSFKLYIHKT